MTKAKQYFKEACERCEEFAAESECEVKENCPVYNLYQLVISKGENSKEKKRWFEYDEPDCGTYALHIHRDDWEGCQGNCDFNPGFQPEMI